MATVAAIYTTQSIIEPIKALFQELMPSHRLVNVLDDGIISDVVKSGNIATSDVRRRFFDYCRTGEELGAQVILSTCSSMGDLVEQVQPFITVPILRIDEPMAFQAVELGTHIAVLATAETTLAPTNRLLHSAAKKKDKSIVIIESLAKGALAALSKGNTEEYEKILLATAKSVAKDADVIMLAQGSMARVQDEIALATGKPVLSSILSGLLSLRNSLENTV
jgi:aspartate/glutamate racemase